MQLPPPHDPRPRCPNQLGWIVFGCIVSYTGLWLVSWRVALIYSVIVVALMLYSAYANG